MTKAIQEKVILNEIKEISLNRIGGNILNILMINKIVFQK